MTTEALGVVGQRGLRALWAVQILLAWLHAMITWAPPDTYPQALVRLVHLDREANLPTWFASSQLLLLAALFGGIALLETTRGQRTRRLWPWLACAAGATFLSIDEAATLHEALGTFIEQAVDRAPAGSFLRWIGKFPSYYWVLVYVPIGLPVAILCVRFLGREITRSRGLALAGVTIYLFGAVVVDAIEGSYGAPNHNGFVVGTAGGAFTIDLVLIEECLEMAGVTLLIRVAGRHVLRISNGR